MSLVLTNDLGTVTVPDTVLAAIAVRAAETVDGVKVRRRRTVDVEAGIVRLAVAVRRGEPIVERVTLAQDEVAAVLKAMCGIEAQVDVAVGELA
jgi:uncharacterized alkaline shock family protein YloU